jgi:iron complex outermembrane recepter protein
MSGIPLPVHLAPPRPLRLAVLASTLAGFALAPAWSQPPAAPQPIQEKVLVTAQRTEQDLQDVPLSILAFDSSDLEVLSIDDIQELAEVAPGLVVSGQTPSTGEVSLFVRGIGSSVQGIGVESTVGFYVDGVYVPRPVGFLDELVDIERIELLRGPQGTLWGRNSTGGALNLLTKRPSGQVAGRLFGEYGQIDGPGTLESQRLTGSVTGPLTERVLGRISASRSQADNYTTNVLADGPGRNRDATSLRGALDFLPTDALSLRVTVDSIEDDHHNNFFFRPAQVGPNTVLGTLIRFYDVDLPADPHRIAADVDPVADYHEQGIHFDVDWNPRSDLRFRSITGVRDMENERTSDIDGTPLQFIENFDRLDSEWWSQELQLSGSSGSLDWIAGVYAFHEEADELTDTLSDQALFSQFFFAQNPQLFLFDPTDFCSVGFLAPTFLCGPDYYAAIAPFLGLPTTGNKTSATFFDRSVETDSYALYGQGYARLTDELTVTAGLRYTVDDKTHSLTTLDAFQTGGYRTETLSDDWDQLTPKLGLEWRPQDDVLVYGSVTTGYKSGGFNSTSFQPSFDQEEILSYEAGVKTMLAGGRARLNVAAFFYDYDDLQVAILFPDRRTVENAAKAELRGFELDLDWRLTDRLRLVLNAAGLDDEFEDFSSQDPLVIGRIEDELNAMGVFDPAIIGAATAQVPLTDLSGNGLPQAPDLNTYAALEYTVDVGRGRLLLRADHQYTDDVAFDPFETFVQESYDLFGAGVSYTSPDDRWWVNVYGKNLGDEDYVLTEFFARVTGSLQVYAPPASWGLQLGLRF